MLKHEILKNITPTIHIETEKELDNHKDLIEKAQKISITAGASTPDSVIDKVINENDLSRKFFI